MHAVAAGGSFPLQARSERASTLSIACDTGTCNVSTESDSRNAQAVEPMLARPLVAHSDCSASTESIPFPVDTCSQNEKEAKGLRPTSHMSMVVAKQT